ncbi:MAG: endonuclease [Pyramidobacter porci]|uniref:endonuclease n=1 Tax=Pyramidobacter porci TaxID=2605789 RepID=UPI002A75125F|nr:endonuclease [Pyramidobacter porci]MCI6260970.1 endonuclease [Pyramidobacter sp.]MDY2647574.1 endonuclease [Pyramidobacter porci]
MYLGIDPGRQKFGWALGDAEGTLVASGIVPAERLEDFVLKAARFCKGCEEWLLEGKLPEGGKIAKVFCGDGTGHARFVRELARHFEVALVEELNTTLEARSLYWDMHPPRGLKRLVPLSLLVPPRCLDDLAAFCILRRALAADAD